MEPNQRNSDPLFAFRPLVRYVDEHQGVVDIHFTTQSIEGLRQVDPLSSVLPLTVCVRVEGPDGQMCEHEAQLVVNDQAGTVRVEMEDPQRWWPSGMGDQSLV